MKARNGFVSNSSSSSFIVAFPKIAEDMTVEELRHMMFGDADLVESGDTLIKTEAIAARVLCDAERQVPLMSLRDDKEALLDEIESGYFPGYPVYPRRWHSLVGEEKYRANDLFDEVVRACAEKLVREFWFSVVYQDELENPFVYIFEYSDSDGIIPTYMEHGNIFRNFTHIVINKH